MSRRMIKVLRCCRAAVLPSCGAAVSKRSGAIVLPELVGVFGGVAFVGFIELTKFFATRGL